MLTEYESDAAEEYAMRALAGKVSGTADPADIVIVREAARVRLARARLALQLKHAGESALKDASAMGQVS